MNWSKVISALRTEAEVQASEADKFKARQRQYSTSCGAAATTLGSLARALEAGLVVTPADIKQDAPS